ncbi:MAG: hypothetical protein EOO61_00110 [Hymenobacter sp.]|nr:MAG: hypothetical protein EOO61_00110 [Hymenobacter sp.]
MTYYQFDILPFEQQLQTVLDTATLLARRFEKEIATCLYLYYLPGGFFTELYYDTKAKEIALLQAFVGSERLVDYVSGIQLPKYL